MLLFFEQITLSKRTYSLSKKVRTFIGRAKSKSHYVPNLSVYGGGSEKEL